MKKIKYFVLAILVIIGLYSFYLYTLFYGGLDGFIAEHRNPPKEERLDPLRSDALKELDIYSVF